MMSETFYSAAMIRRPARAAAQSVGRFTYLMGLYAENYWRLLHVFAPHQLQVGRYVSSVCDQLDVCVELTQVHRYTLELRLSYLFADPVSGLPDPSACVRWYRDAQMAEVQACYLPPSGPFAADPGREGRNAWNHRLRMNGFFNKWLEYLAQLGHSRFTLKPCVAGVRSGPAG